MHRSLNFCAVLVAALLGACGGREEEQVTLLARMELFRETESVHFLKDELAERKVAVLRFQCGYHDREKVPFELRGYPAQGRAERFLLITVRAADEEAVRSIPVWGLQLTPELVTLYHEGDSDPFDCDPVVEAETGRFGG
jgi:hypothetical protein